MRYFFSVISLLSAVPAVLNAAPVAPSIVGQADRERITNSAMTAIFDADQAARTRYNIDWQRLGEEDRKRRVDTTALLDSGQLNSAEDFYHAAFVYQHGDSADDCLTAHALAVISAARGKPEAAWIAAATLDRYLQRIGQPQIYGTQYLRKDGVGWTQEPYRRKLLSDPLRKATGVQPIADQEQQREKMEIRTPKK